MTAPSPGKARRRYADGPFGQVHLREAGEPQAGVPTLVCLHLSPMSSRIYENFVVRMAAEGRHAIAIDTPGFGLSDHPPAPPAIADFARSLLATLDDMGIASPVDLMGYHTGSLIAAEAAVSAPSRVRRVVMVAAPVFTAEELSDLRREYAPVEPREDGSHLVFRWKRFLSHYLGRGLPLEDAAELFTEGFLGGRREWWGHHAAFAFPPGMRLDEIAQPVLVINPDDDLRTYTDRAAPLLRCGRIVDMDGWGHGFLDTDTEGAVRLVASFLAAPDGEPFADLHLPSPTACLTPKGRWTS